MSLANAFLLLITLLCVRGNPMSPFLADEDVEMTGRHVQGLENDEIWPIVLLKLVKLEHTVKEISERLEDLSIPRPTQSICRDGWVSEDSDQTGQLFKVGEIVHLRMDVYTGHSKDYCFERGAHLVRIETSDENDFVENYIRQLNGRHFYIDLSDENQDGWFWKSNGEPATFFDWDEGEPRGGEYCAAISTNAHDHGRWIDLPCDWKFASPLCEILRLKDCTGGTHVAVMECLELG